MTITLETAQRNAANDAVVDSVDGGAPGKLKLFAGGLGGTLLAEFTLSNPAFEASGTAAPGSARAIGGDDTTPISGSNVLTTAGVGAGTADAYEVTDSADTRRWSGVASATGGGGDLQLDNPVIAVSQVVNLSAWTHAQPA